GKTVLQRALYMQLQFVRTIECAEHGQIDDASRPAIDPGPRPQCAPAKFGRPFRHRPGEFVGARDGFIDIVLAEHFLADLQSLFEQLAHLQFLPFVASLSDRAFQRWAFIRLEPSASVSMRQTASMMRSISQSLWPSCAQSRSLAWIGLFHGRLARLRFAAPSVSLAVSSHGH